MPKPPIPSIEEFMQHNGNVTWYLDNLPTGVCIIRIVFDDEGQPADWQYAYCNKELAKLAGMEHSRMQGAHFYRDIFPDGDRKWLAFYSKVAMTGEPASCQTLSPEIGNYLEVHAYSPCYGYCFCTLVNISERLNTEQSIREFQNGIATLMRNQLASFNFYDIDNRIIHNNLHTAVARQISGKHPFTVQDIPHSLVRAGVMTEADGQRLQEQVLTPMEEGASEAEIEMRLNLSAPNGVEDWQWYNVSMHKYISVFPNVRRAICAVRKIQNEVDLRDQLRRKADVDTVTGVYNRSAEEVVAELLQQEDGPFFLYLFDIDDFKGINDSNGHICGDNVLFFFAQLLRSVLANLLVFRLGGDEFAAFACGQNPDTMTAFCTHIEESLRKQEQFPFDIRCSCGIAWSHRPCSYQELYSLADRALYLAKREGKNQWRILSCEDQETAQEQSQDQAQPAPPRA